MHHTITACRLIRTELTHQPDHILRKICPLVAKSQNYTVWLTACLQFDSFYELTVEPSMRRPPLSILLF